MLSTLESNSVSSDTAGIHTDVTEACLRIPPLWDLDNYVAVNPFLGFAGMRVDDAARLVEPCLGGRVLPGFDFFREKWTSGQISPRSLHSASRRLGVGIEVLESVLNGQTPEAAYRTIRPFLSFTERCDQQRGTDWHGHTVRSIARWCAVFAADGGTQWGNARQGRNLFCFWLEAARVDRSLEIIGLSGWRAFMRDVPDDAEEAIKHMLGVLNIPKTERLAYFHRLLGKLYGWASYFRRDAWQQGSDQPGTVGELLTILITADAAVAQLTGMTSTSRVDVQVEDASVRLALQEALEDQYVTTLLGRLNAPPEHRPAARPAVQAVFCIDVRSEVLRRHLEKQSDAIETRGFAGFFGVCLDWRAGGDSSARCPVLLKPSMSLTPPGEKSPGRLAGLTDYVQAAPSAAFSYVELLGLLYGLRITTDALALGRAKVDADRDALFNINQESTGDGLTLASQVELAAGILKNIGFEQDCARIVLLCGHVGHSCNNPHAAGFDCGACGGHGGAINARVAAALLNAPLVRVGLKEKEIIVPHDTYFLPGVHDTSADHVKLLDVEKIPQTHAPDLAALRVWLDQAGAGVRAERAQTLDIEPQRPGMLERLLRRRSLDWSEVRPEWGLSRNAAFIAARRARTYGVDLQGRSFLHEYDASLDTDGSVLNLILCAPMVVASWINLQYFASTVDNDVFGCGNKALHNRIGSIGVVLGNGGDLRTGLSLQSVQASDGTFYHEPLRLQVIVEAPTDRIDTILNAQKSVRDLVVNGWVRLYALDPNGRSARRCLSAGNWEALDLP